MVTETINFEFKDGDFKPYIDIIFKAFGPDRIMFGSDWPVCLLAANYDKVFKIVNDYLENLSVEIKNNILGENAIKIYNL
jgi:L-fuconolactonase